MKSKATFVPSFEEKYFSCYGEQATCWTTRKMEIRFKESERSVHRMQSAVGRAAQDDLLLFQWVVHNKSPL